MLVILILKSVGLKFYAKEKLIKKIKKIGKIIIENERINGLAIYDFIMSMF